MKKLIVCCLLMALVLTCGMLQPCSAAEGITNKAEAADPVYKGIDVTSFVEVNDWFKVAQEIDFAILRVGKNLSYDTKFVANVKGCVDNAIPYGVYYVPSAVSAEDAHVEAEWVISALEGYQIDLPVFLHLDNLVKNVPAEELQAVVSAFCDAVCEAGYKPGLYAYVSIMEEYFSEGYYNSLTKWVREADVDQCTYSGEFTMWQYTMSGRVAGISTDVDLNYFYGDLFGQSCEHEDVAYSFSENTHIFTCVDCGEVAFTKAEGKQFKINSAAPVLGEDIALNYRVTLPAGFENAYMVFEMNGSSTVISDGILNTTGATAGQTSFIFPGINPLTIGDNICATLYAYVDGYEVSLQIPEFSLLKYCDGQLQRTNDANLRTILSDVLVYGAKAQIYSGYKTDALVTDRVSAGVKLTPSTFQALDSSYNLLKVTGDKNADIDYKNAALVLGSKVKVKYGINCTNLEADYVFKINVGGEEFTYTTDDLVADENGNLFLEFDKLRAIMLGEKITATIWDGDTQVGRTVEYSVYTYVQMNQNSSDTALRELLQAIYNYGESAKRA
jgi:GH25 family lysozyme M1 (1,4-beta-N-acetylmuramidase)